MAGIDGGAGRHRRIQATLLTAAFGGSLARTVAIVAVLAVGCTPELPAPVVESVSPSWAYNGAPENIEIAGRHFYPGVRATGDDELSWDRQYRVWFIDDERVELDDVSMIDYEHLSASVPAGLDVGLYAVEIESPTGALASRADVFTVTDTRAAKLLIEPEADQQPVNTLALVQVRLLDNDDAPVEDDLEVEIEVDVGDGDASAVRFSETATLDGQEELEDTLGITGRLDANGEGWFALTSAAPMAVSLRVSPAEADSVVGADSAPLEFTAGAVAGVQISLPVMVSTAAGSSFTISLGLVDEDGNPTSSVEAALLLYETCPGGTYQEAVSFIDKLSGQQVEVTRATNEDCATNSIAAVGYAGGVEISGVSEAFEVVPGPPARLDVFASPDEVAAGSAELSVWVEVRDDYGNAVDDHLGGTPVLTDSIGGLDPAVPQGQQVCSPFTSELSRAWCTVALWKTGTDITVTATDELGLSGASNPITVVPGALADLEAVVDGNDVTAGESFQLELVGIDAFDNPIDVDFASAGELTFQDGNGIIDCEEVRFSSVAVGTAFDCVITRAIDEDAITVYLDVDGVAFSAATEPFDVVNAGLDYVTIDLGGVSSIEAGEELLVTFSGFDAYDNPFLAGADRTIDLSDDGGSVAVTTGGATAALDSLGQAEVALVFTAAREGNRLHVSQSGVALGSSTSFDVVHGSLASFRVTPARTWAWLDEPLEVTITAVDGWDNPVTGFSTAITLRSPSGLGDDVSVTDWDDGAAETEFEFDTAGLGESLRVYYVGLLAGEASATDALDPSCTNGPRASLLIAGEETATLCLSSGTTPTTTLSAADSDAGGASLAAWHWDVGDGDWFRATEAMDMAWTEEGGWRVSLVVADDNACGDAAEAEVYVAEADGRPAGPVTVELDDTTLTTGSESALAEITASDCAGDPAVGDIYAWVNLGDLTDGVSSSLVSSGEGLSVSLVGGVADLKWTVVGEDHDGEGVLHVGALSGAAYGAASATISGDSALPTILAVSPSGSTLAPFSSIIVQFSEPMLDRSVTTSAFSLADSTGIVQSLADVSLSPSGYAATLELASEAGRGVWVLTATDDLRDESGNRLDGTWSGSSGDLTLTFGDVPATSYDVTECEATPASFRPDGDDGSDTEADAVDLALSASGLPDWWSLEVMDEGGSTVYKTRLVPLGSSRDPQVWDGRAQDGSIVDNGVYTVRVSAEDAAWNAGDACSVEVRVDNRVIGIAP